MEVVNSDNIIQLNYGGRSVTYEEIESLFISIMDKYGFTSDRIKQGQFIACLVETGQCLWNKDQLKTQPYKDGMQYDINILNKLAMVFIHLCNVYGGFSTPYAFGMFTGIPFDTIRDMKDANYLSNKNDSPLEKIVNSRDNAIISKLYDSNNVTGQAMLANNILGWNTSRTESKQSITENITTLQADFSSLGLSNFGSIPQNE